MKKYLTQNMNFKKLPFGNTYYRDNVLVIFSKTNPKERTFIIEEPNLTKYAINNFDEIYLIVEEIETNGFILLERNDIKNLTSLFLRNKQGIKRWICKYGLIPIFDDEDVTQTVVISNKYLENQCITTVLLDKQDIKSIIEDNFIAKI